MVDCQIFTFQDILLQYVYLCYGQNILSLYTYT